MNNKAALQQLQQLLQLLRWKRGRLGPSEFGIPKRTGQGWRSPGLSQAQVAQALFVTERTYGLLERGEMASPSQELLDTVAQVLRMEERERTALYVYALGYEPPIPMDPTSGTNVGPA
ncbi:helix-turn-helix transcriptional regulator [Streptomyces violascens]|uniref:helix-turn-helix transcriptional regulator n=1 Tax=Streptomyces violascens TaxID=67381 RepID=UPI003655C3F6